MKIKFADSFWDSLETLRRHDTWWYKTYSTIRYNIPAFFRNIWKFRKDLWYYRWWDYTFMLYFMETSLTDMAVNLEKYGNEVDKSRLKKVDKMLRAAAIIQSIYESGYIGKAEAELGKLQNVGEWLNGVEDTPEQKSHNSKVFDRAHELEEQEWNELWEILKGQDPKEYSKFLKKYSKEEQREKDLWNQWFDGSGMRGWWD